MAPRNPPPVWPWGGPIPPSVRLASVLNETWRERVDRRFQAIAAARPLDPKYSEEQNRQLMVCDAQHQADKEMLDEIHLMLRVLISRISQ